MIIEVTHSTQISRTLSQTPLTSYSKYSLLILYVQFEGGQINNLESKFNQTFETQLKMPSNTPQC